jgi:hypothetical protein
MRAVAGCASGAIGAGASWPEALGVITPQKFFHLFRGVVHNHVIERPVVVKR